MQLVDLIVQSLTDSYPNLEFTHNRLVVTGHNPMPIEIKSGCIIENHDLESTQEEADVIIIHKLLSILQDGKTKNKAELYIFFA